MTETNLTPGILACPACGYGYTHVDEAFVIGRTREDGELVPVHVDQAGRIGSGPYPVSYDGIGRRHEITLAGSCENGCQFRMTFRQHKGETFVELTALVTTATGHQAWVPVKALADYPASGGRRDKFDDDDDL